jgi:serine/threonine-protein kinase RsbW
VEEACTNIVKHAYGDDGCGDIEFTCIIADDGLTVILVDQGCPFDTDCVPQPDLETGLELRKLGGWGLYLMRQLMDEVRFEFSPDAGNILRRVKRKTTRQSCGIYGQTRARG